MYPNFIHLHDCVEGDTMALRELMVNKGIKRLTLARCIL